MAITPAHSEGRNIRGNRRTVHLKSNNVRVTGRHGITARSEYCFGGDRKIAHREDRLMDDIDSPHCPECNEGLETVGSVKHPFWWCPACKVARLGLAP